MAEYGLFCAKLRREGFAVVADLIEKLQAERDAAEQERDKLRLERAALLEIIREGNEFCSTCVHIVNQYADHCELEEHHCNQCSCDECICKDCDYGEHWEWRGVQE